MAVDSPSCIGLPRIWGGSASTTVLSGPSQGSLALRPARLLQPLRLTFVPEASAGRSPYPTAQVATGMNRQFPGRDSHPLVICAFVAHPYIGVVFYFRIKRSHPFSSRSTGYLTPLITWTIELWPAASARTTVAPLIGNGYCRWMTEGPMNNAIPFRESHKCSQLIGIGIGIQVKPQPNGF
jgi:hypothetical protein